jgi:hypothetical protein
MIPIIFLLGTEAAATTLNHASNCADDGHCNQVGFVYASRVFVQRIIHLNEEAI